MLPTSTLPTLLNIKYTIGLELLFYVLLCIFTIQAVFLGYHWLNYGNNKKTSYAALCVYLSGGAMLLLTYSFALNAI
jgi:hypothetical protein